MSQSKLIAVPTPLSLNLSNVEDSELIERLKVYHNQSVDILFKAFIHNINISEIILLRAKHIDTLLKSMWQYLLLPNSISLIAVGGYGRGELHPHSDIDLLILNDSKITNNDSLKIERFITLLWDIGLVIGHSVRNIKQCIDIAVQDITVATSLTEARFLTGALQHFDELMLKTAPDKIWKASAFLDAKVLEKRERYEKFDGSSFDLEPNIKSSPGGLRDIHLVGWLAQRCYYPKTLPMLIKDKLISKREYYALIKSQLFLWKVRFALHTVCAKPEDRLLFDHQKNTAELMGFKDSKGKLGVEKMMKRYYQSVLIIRNVTELLVELIKEDVDKSTESSLKELFTKTSITPIDSNYQIVNNRLDAINPKIFSKKSSELISVFHVLAKLPKLDGLTAKTLRSIRGSRHKINSKFRKNKAYKKEFFDFWSINHQSARAMFMMKRSGVLAAYMPQFRKITGQMQYDMFHSYTVDEHTLFLLRNLTEFSNDQNKLEFSHCHDIMTRQKSPELIYLAALFHDIGKGQGGDHSEIGQEIAAKFCKEHDVPESSTKVITWLVANHLIMSLISQKRDTSDPKVISNFADIVENRQKLELLYILTVADIRATSKSLWNSWKDALLKDLYLNTLAVLNNRKKDSTDATDPIEVKPLWYINRRATKSKLLEQGYSSKDIVELWGLLGNHYFSKRSVEAVVWQTKIVLDAKKSQTTLLGIRQSGERNSNELFIYTKDKQDLFANLTATLNQQGLNIYGAHIYTDKNGYCYDSFFFLNDDDKIVKDIQFQNKIIEAVKANLKMGTKQRVSRRMARQIKHFEVDTKINIFNDEFTKYTRVDITAKNKPGFLASVARAFVKNNVKLHDAKVTTLGERVEDSFLISDQSDEAITDLKKQDLIIETLNQYLN